MAYRLNVQIIIHLIISCSFCFLFSFSNKCLSYCKEISFRFPVERWWKGRQNSNDHEAIVILNYFVLICVSLPMIVSWKQHYYAVKEPYLTNSVIYFRGLRHYVGSFLEVWSQHRMNLRWVHLNFLHCDIFTLSVGITLLFCCFDLR